MNKYLAIPIVVLFVLLVSIPQHADAVFFKYNTNISAPVNGTAYSPFGNISFEIQISNTTQGATDYGNVNNVTFEINGTNYTRAGTWVVYNDTSGNYWINISRHLLPGAGAYNIRWFGNATGGTTNVSEQIAYYVAVNNTNPVRYYVNGVNNASSTTGGSSQVFNVSALLEFTTFGNTVSGTMSMYRNSNTDVSSSIGALTTIPVGTWFYKINTSGNNNYSQNATGIDFTIIINPDSNVGGGGGYVPPIPPLPEPSVPTATTIVQERNILQELFDSIGNFFSGIRLPQLTAFTTVQTNFNNDIVGDIWNGITNFFSFKWLGW